MRLRSRLGLSLMAGGALAALISPALAQEAPPEPTADSAVLSEIVVTAQRRSENIQDVPVAVTVATAAGLAEARVEGLTNITAISPSIVSVTAFNPAQSTKIQIRGIGTTGDSRTFEGAVGVFIDGVYRTRAGQALQNFLDVDTMQILRGPQGTLFGKNTSAGAVLIASVEPDPTGFGGTYEGTVGNYERRLARGAINVPLSETAAFRLAGVWNREDGYITNPNTGEDYNEHRSQAVKAQLLWRPTDTLALRLIADYSKSDENCCYGNVDYFDGPTQPLIDLLTQANGFALPSSDFKDYEQVLTGQAKQLVKDWGVVLKADWDLAAGTLHSVTAYREWQVDHQDSDPDFSGADIGDLTEWFKTRVFSQELTFNGKVGESTDYVLGAYFASEDIDSTRELFHGAQSQAYWDILLAQQGIPPGLADAAQGQVSNEIMDGGSKSYALFTHWDTKLDEAWSLVAGLRFTHEKKRGAFEYAYYRPNNFEVLRLLGVYPAPAYSETQSEDALSGTLGVQYRFNEDAMAYATYNRGFKSGGVNIDVSAGGGRTNNPAEVPGAVPLDPKFKSEKIDGLEFGLKIDYLDGRARTNFAAFYSRLRDLQVAQFLGIQFAIFNAPKAEVYGAEIENTFSLAEGVTLDLAATWLPKAEFGDEIAAVNPVLAGRRFQNASKVSASAAIKMDRPVTDELNLVGRAQVQYMSRFFLDNLSTLSQGGFPMVNASLGLKSDRAGWTVEAFVQNLTDRRYVVQTLPTPLQIGDFNAFVGAPRTYGVTLRGRF